MRSFATASLALVALLPSALAHGFVSTITIGGTAFHGPEPGGSVKSTHVIRQITNTEPNHIDDGAALACGKAAATKGAPAMAKGKAGDTIKFTWDAGDGTPWPHDTGPMITYAANCGDDCKNFDATKAKWFKFDQVGKTKTPSNSWQQGIISKGTDYSAKIPEGIPSGNYLIRHEIIALHLADKLKGAEFYPSCAQVTITGGAAAGTTVGPTASFPGAYKATDPGIHINIWDKLGAYPFPGPALATFGKSSGAADIPVGDDEGDSATSADSATATTSAAAEATSSSSSDDGATADDGGEDDCTDDGDSATTTVLNPTKAAGDSGTKTVTVTVTVTATPTSTKKASTKSDYRRSRARGHNQNVGHQHNA